MLISIDILIKILPLRLIQFLLLILIIQMTIYQCRTEHLTDIINDLDIVIQSTDRVIVWFGLEEIQQLEFLVKIVAAAWEVDTVVLQVDDLDVEVLFEDLKLGFLGEQPADYVVYGFLEFADEGVGAWGKMNVQVADLAGEGVAAVHVLLLNWTIEKYKVWEDGFSEQFVVELRDLNALTDFSVVSFDFDFFLGEYFTDKNGL